MNLDEPLQFPVVRKVAYEEIRGGDRTWRVAFTDLHVPQCETSAPAASRIACSPFFRLPPPRSQRVPLGIFVATM